MEVGYIDPDPVNVSNRISLPIRLVQYRTLDLGIIQKDHTYDDHHIRPQIGPREPRPDFRFTPCRISHPHPLSMLSPSS